MTKRDTNSGRTGTSNRRKTQIISRTSIGQGDTDGERRDISSGRKGIRSEQTQLTDKDTFVVLRIT